jgi:glycerol-3-phosphate dehydrogenase (NAD(P)+)
VGYRLAQGESLAQIMETLGSTAEGVRTTETVWKFAQAHKIYMPITEAVYHVVQGEVSVRDALKVLMNKPSMAELG